MAHGTGREGILQTWSDPHPLMAIWVMWLQPPVPSGLAPSERNALGSAERMGPAAPRDSPLMANEGLPPI